MGWLSNCSVGDLHNNEFGENNQTLLGAVKEAKPDIILIVGDLMVVKEWKEKDFSITDTILKGLSEIAPVYYANEIMNFEWNSHQHNILDGTKNFSRF